MLAKLLKVKSTKFTNKWMKLERKKEIEVNPGKIDYINYAYSKEITY